MKAVMTLDTNALRPLEWHDVPSPTEFVPLILKFMLQGEVLGCRIQDKIRREKGCYLRVTKGSGRERGTPNASPSNKFQNNFDWAIGDYMQNELGIIKKTSVDSVTRSGNKTYKLLPEARGFIEKQDWDTLFPEVAAQDWS